MGVIRGASKVIKPFVDVKGWLGYQTIADSTRYVKDTISGLLTPESKEEPESFEDAVRRLGLNEEKIAAVKRGYLQQTLIYLGFSLSVAIYIGYLLSLSAFMAALIASLVMSLGLVCAYRAHFWVYQLSVKRLGCTFKEWLAYVIGGQKA